MTPPPDYASREDLSPHDPILRPINIVSSEQRLSLSSDARAKASHRMLPKQPNQSLIHGIRCLLEVVSQPYPIGISELAAHLKMDTTRVHRYLRTLSHLGFLRRDQHRKYGPGPAVYVLAVQSLHASNFVHVAIPLLEELKDDVQKIVAMGALWNQSVSYLYHASPVHKQHQAGGGFAVWPATDSGLGMVLLAQQSDEEIRAIYHEQTIPNFPKGIESLLTEVQGIREAGYAFMYVKTAGNHTLALPVIGNPTMAIGISGLLTRDDVPELLEKLRTTLRQINVLNLAHRKADTTPKRATQQNLV